MKNRIVSVILALFLVLPLCPALSFTASADPVNTPEFSGSGTEIDPWIIADAAGWAQFAADVNAGTSVGGYYKLAENFDNTDSPVTVTVGTAEHPFSGVLDGGGRTLNVAIIDSENVTAPFRYASGATIENLTVAGTVSGNKYTAGLIGDLTGTCIVRNCRIRATITVSKAANAGGLVGFAHNASLTVLNTVFSGVMHHEGNTSGYAGGLVSWSRNMDLQIDGFLFAGKCTGTDFFFFHPVALTIAGFGGTATVHDVYYSEAPGTRQGCEANVVTNKGTRLYTSEYSLIRPSRTVLGCACGTEDDVASVDVPPEIDYTGQVIDTDVFVPHLPDGTLLTKDVDYTVSVSPSPVSEPGIYILTYTGIGNFRGTLSAQFFVSKDQRILTAADTVWQDGGTYFVRESLTVGSRITVQGDVRLYLCAGVQLKATKGIDVPSGSSLTIDAENDSGKLTANLSKDDSSSAIGAGNTDDCGNITINGGSVTVSSHGQAAAIGTGIEGSSGSITINGGRIKATATGSGAAIGAGYWHASASVTINGGVITAEANERAAIGSAGQSSSVVVINGGTITASGTPGIGCGNGGSTNVTINGGIINATGIGCRNAGTSSVTINGGRITSTGTMYCAGIGPGIDGSAVVTINGGNISATGGRYAFGIEGSPLTLGWTEDTDSVYASSYGGEIVFAEHKNFARADNGDFATVANIEGATIVPFNGTPRAITVNDPAHGTAQLNVNTAHEGQTVTVTWSTEYPYIFDSCTVSGADAGYPFTRTGRYSGCFVMPDEDVNVYISTFQAPNLTVSAAEGSVVCAPLLDNRTSYDSGWYAVTGSVELNDRMVASGDVKIWLCDGSELICRRGIQVLSGNSLTVEGTGRLIADASGLSGCAGIGGNNKNGYPYGGGGTVIIRGGVIEACGGDQAAGIGGCSSGGCDAVTITGGRVEAYGEWLAAGIGGGYEGNGGEISITGGQVTAIGGKYAQGIGGGYQSGGADILLSWTTINDYIEANGYNGTVNVSEGKIFLRGDTKERIKPENISELGLCRMVPRYGTEYTLYFKIQDDTDQGGTLRYDLVEGELLRVTPPIEYPLIFAGYEAVDIHQNQVPFTEIENHGFEIVMPAYTVYLTLHLTRAESAYIETPDGNNKYYIISPDHPCLGNVRYYVPADLTITERLVIEDAAAIYLCEGATLTCAQGITVAEGCALQIEGEGALIADGRPMKYAAGIGGGGLYAACGKIVIKGGSVTAYGGQAAAGIGCGAFADGGMIAIYGGQVTAVGGKDGVGVGGNAVYVGTDEVFTDIILGWSSPDDFIDVARFGGSVFFAEDNYLMLRDTGELATRENYAGHVLAPYTGAMYTLDMTPIPDNQSSAYFYSAADHIENDLTPPALVPAGITISVAAAPVYPYDFDGVTLEKQGGGTEQAALLRLESLITYYTFTMPADNVTLNAVMTELQPVTRETPEGTFSFMPLRAYHNNWSSDDYGLNYVLDRDIDAGTRGFVVWEGQAKLYLDAGATLTCSAIRMVRGEGITIYGEGTLNVDGSQFTLQSVTGGPGIGPGNITIYGGDINAKGDEFNPGIGSCMYVSDDSVASSFIAIHGGNINAFGGYWGTAAIGCGYRGGVDSITITGGSVNAVGGHWGGAGIGGSMMNECANIVITGGNITAIGYNGGAGVGGGGYARGGDITITGGVIFAQSVENARGYGYGAGVGDGTQASGAHIVITGGQITAVGGTRQDFSQPGFPKLSSAGIGSGWKSGNDDEITIGWTGRDDYIDAGPTGFGGTVTFVQGDGFLFEGTNISATPGSAGDGRLVPYVENADLTPPEAKTGLVYTGQAQALIDEGFSAGGTLKYCLSSDRPDDGDYQTSVPTAVAAGTYKVWYKAFGDASHNDSDAAFLYVTVGRKSVTVTLALSEDEYIYDRTAKEPTVTVYANGAVIDPTEYTVAYSDNILAGEAALTVESKSDGNYSFTGGAAFTILRRHITVSGLSAESKEYDGLTRAAVVGTPLLEGLIDGDKVTLMDGFAEFYTPNPGVGKPVYFWSFAIDGPDADNYYFDEQPEDVTADITVEAIAAGDTLIESNGGVVARLFTPATNGRYRFAADSETYPAIFIYDGEDEIYDGFMGAYNGFFNFSLELEGGKDYLILLVTSYSGTLTLTVEPAVAYTITVDDCIEGGEIYCDEECGIEGQWIEIGTGAFGGYELIEWTVTTESGDPVDKEEHGFYMPASNVTVSARFGPLREFTLNFAGELSENDVEITVQINGDAVDPSYVYAAEGQTVTLLVTFAGRYTLNASVRSDGGTDLPCTVGAVSGGWRVTFTMPDEEAAITLTTTPAASTDLNCDGVTDIRDVTALLNYLSTSACYSAAFDLDGNGSVSITDVTQLLNILAGN